MSDTERERERSIEDPQLVSQIVKDISKINTRDFWLVVTLSILSASRVFRGIPDWYPSLAGHWWFWWRQWFGHHRASGCVPWRHEFVYHLENPKNQGWFRYKCKESLDVRFDSHESCAMHCMFSFPVSIVGPGCNQVMYSYGNTINDHKYLNLYIYIYYVRRNSISCRAICFYLSLWKGWLMQEIGTTSSLRWHSGWGPPWLSPPARECLRVEISAPQPSYSQPGAKDSSFANHMKHISWLRSWSFIFLHNSYKCLYACMLEKTWTWPNKGHCHCILLQSRPLRPIGPLNIPCFQCTGKYQTKVEISMWFSLISFQ